MEMKYARMAVMALSAFCFAGASSAAELTGTLKKIKETGVISMGIRESSVPFSYYDQNQHTVGYSYDIAQRVVSAIEETVGRKDLKVKLMPITSQNRIPLVQNGTIDFECGSTANTITRQAQVAFSNSIFIYGIRMVTKANSGIKDYPDLAGKTVASTAGTTDELLLRKMNAEKKMNMSIISAQDHSQGFESLATGRAVAFVMDDPILYGERAKARNPAEFEVVGTSPVTETYGCMLRKDDPAFKKIMDDTIAQMQTSGAAEKLYDKWFNSPIPPNGINLHYPLSAEMREMFRNPNDKALH
jgi:glutamate/aspartate transport system substrate-binding protein